MRNNAALKELPFTQRRYSEYLFAVTVVRGGTHHTTHGHVARQTDTHCHSFTSLARCCVLGVYATVPPRERAGMHHSAPHTSGVLVLPHWRSLSSLFHIQSSISARSQSATPLQQSRPFRHRSNASIGFLPPAPRVFSQRRCHNTSHRSCAQTQSGPQ